MPTILQHHSVAELRAALEASLHHLESNDIVVHARRVIREEIVSRCKHCGTPAEQHLGSKCLFQPTHFEPNDLP